MIGRLKESFTIPHRLIGDMCIEKPSSRGYRIGEPNSPLAPCAEKAIFRRNGQTQKFMGVRGKPELAHKRIDLQRREK